LTELLKTDRIDDAAAKGPGIRDVFATVRKPSPAASRAPEGQRPGRTLGTPSHGREGGREGVSVAKAATWFRHEGDDHGRRPRHGEKGRRSAQALSHVAKPSSTIPRTWEVDLAAATKGLVLARLPAPRRWAWTTRRRRRPALGARRGPRKPAPSPFERVLGALKDPIAAARSRCRSSPRI